MLNFFCSATCTSVLISFVDHVGAGLQGLNVALFSENKNLREYISMVPTSAHTGDGMGNLIALLCELAQTMLAKRIMYSEELQATVMEVGVKVPQLCFCIVIFLCIEY